MWVNCYLQITIPPQFLKQIATETINTDPDRLELITEFCVRNLQIEQLAMMLRIAKSNKQSGRW